jgi:ADP-heptose:LPS heptosyltransferase
MIGMAAFAMGPRVPGVRRIAALRANALGDLLVALPALEAVRAAYPDAELVLLARRWHHEFLSGRPGPVDRVIELPPLLGVSVPDDGDAPTDPPADFIAALRAERFDVALQLHGGGRFSNPFVRRLGARVTAGPRARDAQALDRWFRYEYWQHEALRYLEVAALVGAAPVSLQATVAVTESDRAEALRVVPAVEGRLVAVHPGAGDRRRRWPAERFAAVADALAGDGAHVVVTGDAADRDLVARVVGAMRRPARPLAGALSLGGLAGLLERCALVMGNDTGPLHLARAVGVPTVAVYWAGNLLNAGPLGRGRHRTPVSWTTHCPVCGVNVIEERCDHDPSFVAAVGAEPVLEEARDLLAIAEGTNATS